MPSPLQPQRGAPATGTHAPFGVVAPAGQYALRPQVQRAGAALPPPHQNPGVVQGAPALLVEFAGQYEPGGDVQTPLQEAVDSPGLPPHVPMPQTTAGAAPPVQNDPSGHVPHASDDVEPAAQYAPAPHAHAPLQLGDNSPDVAP